MTKFFVGCALALTVIVAAPALVSSQGEKATDAGAVAAVTKLENDQIKAALANDSSFFERFLSSDFTAARAVARGIPGPPCWRT
jgi:hypothetical protein